MHHLFARWIGMALLGLACGLPAVALAQGSARAPLLYTQEELIPMAAPVALHPDTMLAQLLVAATYPLELVQAQRFLAANPALKGEALAKAGAAKGWDGSVVSLLQFPALLAMMTSRLEWTQQLGDAMLAQRPQLLDTVQGLRTRALQAGKLQSDAQQRIQRQDALILIEAGESLALPYYDPLLVYGLWSGPQPWVWVPPPSQRPKGMASQSASAISWGASLTLPTSTWHDKRVDWLQRQILVRGAAGEAAAVQAWRHDPVHRKGVAYRDESVRLGVGAGSATRDASAPRGPSHGDDEQIQPRPNPRARTAWAKGKAAAPSTPLAQPSPLQPGAAREVVLRQAERGRASRQSGAAQSATAATSVPARSLGPRPGQPAFDGPSAAVQALVKAVRAGKREQVAALLGRGAGRLLDSGDPRQDARARSNFLAAYEQRHYLEADGEDRATLLIGEGSWPLPFQIVQTPQGWHFDSLAGLQHYLDRQAGANELAVIEVLRTYVLAQREFARRESPRDGLLDYAQRMISSLGRHDGLYWASPAGEPPAPMGARFAMAGVGSQRGSDEAPQPFNGYYFRLLSAQGPAAAGGAYEYLVNGRQIGGHALLATPARHGVSGVMSFIVNHDGVVYSSNLGRQTATLATGIERFDPGAGWQRESQP